MTASDRILVSHVGSLPRSADLVDFLIRRENGEKVDDGAFDRAVEEGVARVVAVVCAIFISFTYVAGQMRGVGLVFSRFLEVDITIGVLIVLARAFFMRWLKAVGSVTGHTG